MTQDDRTICPHCGQRDFVLQANGDWVCLQCHYLQVQPPVDLESTAKPDLLSLIVAALIVVMILSVVVGL